MADAAHERGSDGTGPGASLDLHRLGLVEVVLADVDHALTRLDAGTWGTCEHCGAPLDPRTLAERPAARACGTHG